MDDNISATEDSIQLNTGNEDELIEEKYVNDDGEDAIRTYTKGKFLGKGGFAKCYDFICIEDNQSFAAKIVSKQNLQKSSSKQKVYKINKSKLKSEIKIHKSLNHKNIVKFEHVFEDENNVYILLELCKNKTLNELHKKRKTLTEMEVRFYLEQIVNSVKYKLNINI